jgi:F0F1-type ATP synthase gamma subunit
MSVEAMAQLPATPQGLEPLLQTLLQKVRVWQEDGVAQITALYTQRSESGALLPVKQVLWPIPFETLERAQQSEWPTNKSPLVFANRVETMTLVLRQLLKSGLVNACMNSMLSESSARLANLQVAEDNINQHLEELQQKHNTLRQSTITAELQDITAAFDMISSRA